MSGALLRVDNLRKQFKKKLAVAGVSFSMANGEIVGLLGPNGAGKTTIFYMIVGFIKVSGGSIFLNKKDITHQPMYIRAREGISYLPQEASIFRKLSVEKISGLFLKHGITLQKRKRSIVLTIF